MKYVVGIMLTSFGTFFAGEGIGVHWWKEDVSLLPLIAIYGAGSLVAGWVLRNPRAVTVEVRFLRSVRAAAGEVWGLFVDDGALAIATVAVLLGVAVFVDHATNQKSQAAVLLVIGVFVAVAVSLSGAIRQSWTRTRTSETMADVEAVLEDGEVTDKSAVSSPAGSRAN